MCFQAGVFWMTLINRLLALLTFRQTNTARQSSGARKAGHISLRASGLDRGGVQGAGKVAFSVRISAC